MTNGPEGPSQNHRSGGLEVVDPDITGLVAKPLFLGAGMGWAAGVSQVPTIFIFIGGIHLQNGSGKIDIGWWSRIRAREREREGTRNAWCSACDWNIKKTFKKCSDVARLQIACALRQDYEPRLQWLVKTGWWCDSWGEGDGSGGPQRPGNERLRSLGCGSETGRLTAWDSGMKLEDTVWYVYHQIYEWLIFVYIYIYIYI